MFEALSDAYRLRRALEEIALDRRHHMSALLAREWAKPADMEKAMKDAAQRFEEAEEETIRLFDGADPDDDAKPWWTTKPEHRPGAGAGVHSVDDLAGDLDVEDVA